MILDVGSIIDKTVHYNKTIFIENDLSISNSTIIMDGKGFILNNTAILTLRNSSIMIGDQGDGYYMDLLGDAAFHNSVIDGCLDVENGYFGIYVDGSRFQASDLKMRRSGMLRVDGGAVEMSRSTINGLVSFSGNVTMDSCVVDQTGITQLGEGDVLLRDVVISTNISFTQSASFSALEGADIELENVEILGSFNGGLSISDSRASFRNVSISLDDGVFGIRASDTHIASMDQLSIDGVSFGIEMDNSTMDRSISRSVVRSIEFGIALRGNSPIRIQDSEVHEARYGVVTSSPLFLDNTTMVGNVVGLLAEDSSIEQVEGCTFTGYTQWGIEDETWQPGSYPGNLFEPSETGLGQVAWWGWVDIEVWGPDGISVVGADVMLEQKSGKGSIYEVDGESIGLVWGFTDGSGNESEMRYDATARWGNSRKEVFDFLPEKGKALSIQLNLTDIWIKDLEFEDGSARVTVACEGSEAKDVEVLLLVDGIEYNSHRMEIEAGEVKNVAIPLSGIEPGHHTITAVVSSNDEYKLMNGYLQGNNAVEIEEFVRPERDDGELGLLLVGIVAGVFLLLLLLIFIRKQD
jgi:hypothetical protein